MPPNRREHLRFFSLPARQTQDANAYGPVGIGFLGASVASWSSWTAAFVERLRELK